VPTSFGTNPVTNSEHTASTYLIANIDGGYRTNNIRLSEYNIIPIDYSEESGTFDMDDKYQDRMNTYNRVMTDEEDIEIRKYEKTE